MTDPVVVAALERTRANIAARPWAASTDLQEFDRMANTTVFHADQRVVVALDEDGWTSAYGTVEDAWVEGGRERVKVTLDDGHDMTVPATTVEAL